MGKLTRFYDRASGQDGPVSGAIMIIPVHIDDIANNETSSCMVKLPAGMGFEIVDINLLATSVTSTPVLTIGSAAAGAEIVAAVDVTTNLGSLTIVEGTVAASALIDVRIVAGAAEAAESVTVAIVGYPISPPDSIPSR